MGKKSGRSIRKKFDALSRMIPSSTLFWRFLLGFREVLSEFEDFGRVWENVIYDVPPIWRMIKKERNIPSVPPIWRMIKKERNRLIPGLSFVKMKPSPGTLLMC